MIKDNRFMFKIRRKDILIVVLILIMTLIMSFSFLLHSERVNIIENNLNEETKVYIDDNVKERDYLKVFIQSDTDKERKKLNLNEKNFFISKTLQPWFIFEGEKVKNLKVYFDDSDKDLLTSKFLSVEKIDINKNIKARFKYMLEPQEHKIRLSYTIDNGNLIEEEYLITPIFYDNFSQKLNESSFWGMTEEDLNEYDNWKTENGKLIANDFEAKELNGASSLFFIKKFNKDFFIQFDLTPKGDIINFNTYLLERGINLIFGNGSRKNISMRSKIEKFNFESNQTYQIRLIRVGDDYQVYINDNYLETGKHRLILSYSDNNIGENISKSFGFAVWPKTDGIEIDNFYMANINISEFLK